MLNETKISKGYQTVVPAQIRKSCNIEPGDILMWKEKNGKIIIEPRKKITLKDIVGIVSIGGDAVKSKKAIQAGKR